MCLEYAQRIYSQYDVGAVHTDPSSQMAITLSWTQQSTANTIEAVSINISFDLMYHPGNSLSLCTDGDCFGVLAEVEKSK